MKNLILSSLDSPGQLEKLYRSDKVTFKREFSSLYPQLKGQPIADCWNERLNFDDSRLSWGTPKEVMTVLGIAVLAGLVAKLPALLAINEEFFYTRNVGFIVFSLLSVYFSWKNRLSGRRVAFAAGVTLLCLVFINFLPDVRKSDTLTLSCVHLLIVLWSTLGFVFVGEENNRLQKRLVFLKYNGDLVVMSALILLAGAILSGVTIGLFALIGFHIEKFYFQNVGVFGLAAVPVVATFLTENNPHLVGRVSPVIAKIFSPLVLVMLVIYLIAIVRSGKDPYNDREFLLIFNILLLGVMAIIFFSIAGSAESGKSRAETGVLFLLSVLTIIVNGIALSAIVFRISEWGITPNRIAVLGSNVLILIHLFLVAVYLFRVLSKKSNLSVVERSIAFYLPLYAVWALIVTFIFPFLFGFK